MGSDSWSPTRRGFATPQSAVSRRALHCSEDAVVEPRLALGVLRAHLRATAGERYRFHAGTRIVGAGPRSLVDAAGTRWEGDLAVVATGVAFDHLPGSAGVASKLRRVRLQMFETAPFAARLTTSLADADSMRYYPAYEVAPLDDLGVQNEVAAAHRLQLLVVQRPDGGLTVGDTHEYEEPFEFALCEDPTTELLSRAEAILGAALHRCGAAGRVSTRSAPTEVCACARRSSPASSWSQGRAVAA